MAIKDKATIVLLISLLLIGVIFCFSGNQKPVMVEPQKITFLKPNVYQLQSDFNDYCKENNINFNIKSFDIKYIGSNKTYEYDISNDIIIAGDINSENHVTSCILISTGDPNNQMVAMAALVAINDNTLSGRDLGDFVIKVLKCDNLNGIARNGIKYSYFKLDNVNTFTIGLKK